MTTKGKKKVVSIILPAFNEEKLLGDCLDAVLASTRAFTRVGLDHELIVCDNNSTDRTAAIAREKGARVIFEPRNQIARARNRGASIARGEFLVFLDADSHPTPRLFRCLVERGLRPRDVAGGGCRVDLSGGLTPFGRLGVFAWRRISRWMNYAAGSFIFCRRDIFQETGGFPEQYYASEEVHFSRRVHAACRRHGLRFVLLPVALESSARKVSLYTRAEFLALFLGFLREGPAALMKPQPLWYDGRR